MISSDSALTGNGKQEALKSRGRNARGIADRAESDRDSRCVSHPSRTQVVPPTCCAPSANFAADHRATIRKRSKCFIDFDLEVNRSIFNPHPTPQAHKQNKFQH
jgi:hypothetical protein